MKKKGHYQADKTPKPSNKGGSSAKLNKNMAMKASTGGSKGKGMSLSRTSRGV